MTRCGLWATAISILLLAGSLGLAAGQPVGPRAVGFVATRGEVWVDRQATPSGTAVFAGDTVTTGRASAVEVHLHSGATAALSENGELTLAPDQSGSAFRLTHGTMEVRSASPQAARIQLQNATVIIEPEAGFPALCRVASAGRLANVYAGRGRIAIHSQGAQVRLLPGQSMRLENGIPQIAGQSAGKVTNAIPDETVQHPGEPSQNPLKVNDGVVWEDLVRTLGAGRVRIALEDGSIINIGARSIMRITKHDVQSQQTTLELQLGKLRGQVVKLAKPGASFQVKTKTAVIGVVGTIFLVEALPDLTRVRCLEGMVSVKSISPAIAGETVLHAGEQTNVGLGQAPDPSSPSMQAEVTDELNLTNAGELPSTELARLGEIRYVARVRPPLPRPSQAAGTGGQATGTGVSVTSALPLNAAGLGAGAAAAGASGVAVSRAGGAKDAAAGATTAANQAASASQSAASAATAAGNAGTAFSNGIDQFIQSISPGGPGCGCLP